MTDDDDDTDLDEQIETKIDEAAKTFDEPKVELKTIKRHKGTTETDTEVIPIDKRSITSKSNALKSGKYAKLPIYCNDCYYRAKDVGGNGKCEAYEKDSICTVRDDIKKYCGEMDSRDPDILKTIVDNQIKMLQERVMFSVFAAGMDGNLLDKATNAQMNSLHTYIKLMKELQGTVKISATQEETEGGADADFLSKMFRQVSVEKS